MGVIVNSVSNIKSAHLADGLSSEYLLDQIS